MEYLIYLLILCCYIAGNHKTIVGNTVLPRALAEIYEGVIISYVTLIRVRLTQHWHLNTFNNLRNWK